MDSSLQPGVKRDGGGGGGHAIPLSNIAVALMQLRVLPVLFSITFAAQL